ncbi:MAG: hypothetical protein AAGG79_06105 [Pseudomonadota bacterium]
MQTIKSYFLSAVLPACLVAAGAYQILMGLNGPQGHAHAEQLATLKMQRQALLDNLEAQKEGLEQRADRLLLVNLDEDLLEERVRANLGHMRPEEFRIAASELDELAAMRDEQNAELTSLIAVALLEGAGV